VANAAGTLFFPAIGWWILMRSEGMKVTLWTTLKANFMGFPINFIAPSLYLGAEPLKTFYVSHVHGEQRRKVLATIIVSKFQEIGAILFIMMVAVGIAIWKVDFSRKQEMVLIGTMVFLIAIFTLGVYAFVGNFKPTVKIINFLARFKKGRRRLARLRTRAKEMEHLIHGAFTKRWKTFVAAQAVTMLSAVTIIIRPWIFFYFKDGMHTGIEDLCAIYVVTNLINVLPHTPGALGVMETFMVALFAITGMGKDQAAALSVVNRLSDLILLVLGGWLIFHYNMQAMAKRVAKGEEQVSVDDAEGAREEPPPSTPEKGMPGSG
jgi:uncharacterized protein (TIRG00374 family)